MDAYSYQCGVIDAFNEIVSSGVKELALSHPTTAKEAFDLLPFVIGITQKYGTFYEVENDLLITDLCPVSANKGKTVILFWKDPDAIEKYKELKKWKAYSLKHGSYGETRADIAREFGKLLSYSDAAIKRLFEENKEKEA